MKNKIRLISINDLAETNLATAQVEGIELVVANCNNTISVFEGRCPHQGTLLSEGELRNGTLVCRAHGWGFNCNSGEKIDNPNICLKSFAASVEDGAVMIDGDEVLAWKNQSLSEGPPAAMQPSTHSPDDLPGPKGLPFLGNSLQLDFNKLHRILEAWSRMYGPVYKFSIGGKRMIAIADPELSNQILRHRPEGFRRLGLIEPVLKEIGANGVFSAEGDNWRRQRSLVMQALDTRHLRQFFPTLVKVTERLKNRWKQAASDNRPVEVQKDLMRFTVDVTTNLAFGYDINTLEQEGDIIQQHLEKILPMINSRIYAIFPYWRYFKLPKDRSLDAALEEIRATVNDLVTNARERMAQNPALAQHPTNLLEALLVARDEGDARFTDDEIFANAVTILLAGEDTTANTIAWMFYFMMQYPEVQRNMQAEVDNLLGHIDMLYDYNEARKLSYVEAVAHETMRFKPVAPLLGFDTNAPLAVGGITIPEKTSVMLLTRPAGLQDTEFAQATEFQPERWLSAGYAGSLHHRKSFIPFGSGPRLCPGRSLALLEIKTVMAMVCRNFNLAQANATGPVAEYYAFTMMPTNLYAKFSSRSEMG